VSSKIHIACDAGNFVHRHASAKNPFFSFYCPPRPKWRGAILFAQRLRLDSRFRNDILPV
jgi:hypothetical protein